MLVNYRKLHPNMLKATYEVTQSLEGYRNQAQSVFETSSEYFCR